MYVCSSEYYFSIAAKFGVHPSGCAELAKHVKLNCPNLVFSGLMTIGMLDYTSTPENFKVKIYSGIQKFCWSGNMAFICALMCITYVKFIDTG